MPRRISKKFKEEEQKHFQKAFHESLQETFVPKAIGGRCECRGCSCPPRAGDLCDGGSLAGYAGGYFGSNFGIWLTK